MAKRRGLFMEETAFEPRLFEEVVRKTSDRILTLWLTVANLVLLF